MDRSLPPRAIGLFDAKAGVFAPALIEEVDVPVRERSPYQSRKRIDDAAELVLHSPVLSRRIAVTRRCTNHRPNVDHTLVSVCGEAEAIASRDICWKLLGTPVVVRHMLC